jgi:hypothetical protein
MALRLMEEDIVNESALKRWDTIQRHVEGIRKGLLMAPGDQGDSVSARTPPQRASALVMDMLENRDDPEVQAVNATALSNMIVPGRWIWTCSESTDAKTLLQILIVCIRRGSRWAAGYKRWQNRSS